MTNPPHRGIFHVGDVLNNTYRIEEVLGRGGTSEVYRARSEISGRVVALKALRLEYSRNEDFLALMTREEDMREIRHDAIVRYYDNQRTDDGLVYLVMDYVEGPGLDRKIKDGGMSADDLMIVARRVTEGLIAAHAKNIVHRDLSPDNIILRHGNPADAVIIDFGIAKDTNPGAETIVGNEFAGKYAYAAPEQLSGQTDARADIYALGALLLATFKGEKPDIGANPMEVIAHKAKPLDTDGVPEPLKTLIDRMTDPDREKRLQTARAVLEQIDGPASSPVDAAVLDFGDDDGDKTVIVPRKAPSAQTSPPQKAPTKPEAKPAAPDSGGKGKLMAGALVLIAALGVGGYFAGLFDGLSDPRLPAADPYTLLAERQADGPVQVTGHVPSEAIAQEMRALTDSLGGDSDLTLASGDIADSWGDDMLQLIGILSVLPEWRLAVDGNEVTVTGTTDDPAQQAQLSALFQDGGLPPALTGSSDIALKPQILSAETVTDLLTQHQDCGPLQLIDPPVAGFGSDAQIMVLGKVASVETRVALSDALSAVAQGRPVLLNIDTMNPTLCLVDEVLPTAPEGDFGITFRMGDDGSENTSGRFFVGENPVIDVTIPAGIDDGFLFVSALDVSGNVFHLLPNLLMEDNSIASLRGDAQGAVDVRVAYPLADAVDGSKLAFKVDDSALGKTRIVVIQAEEQMFDGLRPTTESAGGYAEALKDYSGFVRTLDSRILTTAKP